MGALYVFALPLPHLLILPFLLPQGETGGEGGGESVTPQPRQRAAQWRDPSQGAKLFSDSLSLHLSMSVCFLRPGGPPGQ